MRLWHIVHAVISTLGKLRQEALCKFKASLYYIARPFPRGKNKEVKLGEDQQQMSTFCQPRQCPIVLEPLPLPELCKVLPSCYIAGAPFPIGLLGGLQFCYTNSVICQCSATSNVKFWVLILFCF